MMGKKIRLVGALLLMFVAPGFVAAQVGEEVAELYQVQHLRHDVIQILARKACGGRDLCRVRAAGDGYFELEAPPDAQARFALFLEAKDIPPPTQIFQLHILRASKEPGKMPVLPGDAVDALIDLMQLLPFKSFELVDSGFMRTSREARTFLGSDRRYEASLRFRGDPTSGKPLQIEFSLETERWLPSKGAHGAALQGLDLMETTFAMKVGETVVVGTSKLNGGGKALVVLLTAK